MLKPLGDRVVLKVEEKEQKVGGFVIAGAGQDATKEAKVIAVGQGIRTLNGELVAPSVKPGDKVLVMLALKSKIKMRNSWLLEKQAFLQLWSKNLRKRFKDGKRY